MRITVIFCFSFLLLHMTFIINMEGAFLLEFCFSFFYIWNRWTLYVFLYIWVKYFFTCLNIYIYIYFWVNTLFITVVSIEFLVHILFLPFLCGNITHTNWHGWIVLMQCQNIHTVIFTYFGYYLLISVFALVFFCSFQYLLDI